MAKLALVTSRDEEEDEIDKGGTDSSNDTDATLVEDGPSRPTIDTPDLSQSSEKSVLGKRGRDLDGKSHEMEVESPISQSPMERDGFVMISCKDKASVEPQKNSVLEASSSKMQTNGHEGNGVSDSKSPPRKRPEPSDSTMMFGKSFETFDMDCSYLDVVVGKQHDVAECMDNCMFQIETALLRFDDINDSFDKTSVVKR